MKLISPSTEPVRGFKRACVASAVINYIDLCCELRQEADKNFIYERFLNSPFQSKGGGLTLPFFAPCIEEITNEVFRATLLITEPSLRTFDDEEIRERHRLQTSSPEHPKVREAIDQFSSQTSTDIYDFALQPYLLSSPKSESGFIASTDWKKTGTTKKGVHHTVLMLRPVAEKNLPLRIQDSDGTVYEVEPSDIVGVYAAVKLEQRKPLDELLCKKNDTKRLLLMRERYSEKYKERNIERNKERCKERGLM